MLRSAQIVFDDWVGAGRASGRHVAFRARGCLREHGEGKGAGKGKGAEDCSWVSAAEFQMAGRALEPAAASMAPALSVASVSDAELATYSLARP